MGLRGSWGIGGAAAAAEPLCHCLASGGRLGDRVAAALVPFTPPPHPHLRRRTAAARAAPQPLPLNAAAAAAARIERREGGAAEVWGGFSRQT